VKGIAEEATKKDIALLCPNGFEKTVAGVCKIICVRGRKVQEDPYS
jgi:hypothetical protein